MALTQVVLDRQAKGRVFTFGTTSASGEALLTLEKGTAATSTVVLDVKASATIAGDLNLTGNLNITGAINEVSVNTLSVTDFVIRVNKGGSTPSNDTSGLEIEGTGATKIGAIYYDAASATKFSIGDGTTQVDIVDVSTAQTLSNKTIAGSQITGNISGNAGNVTGIVATANGGTGVNMSSLAAEDVILGASGTTMKRLAVGGNGDVLTVVAGAVAWAAPSGGSGITTLNTLTGATQTFATGTAGTDFGISSAGTTHTFNIPDASGSARGLVTTGAQTFAGVKTLTSELIGTRVLLGLSALNSDFSAVVGSAPHLTMFSTTHGNCIAALRGQNNSLGANIYMAKSRATDGSANTALADNDQISRIIYYAADGTDFLDVAVIGVEVDGTPGAGIMPTAMFFGVTRTGFSAWEEALRITPDLSLQVNNPFYTASLPLKLDASKVITSAAISLSSAEVTGTLPVNKGGTGIATATAYGTIIAGTTGTGAFQVAAPGTAGHVLTSNGAGAAPSYQAVTAVAYQRATAVTGTQDSSNKTFAIANAVSADSEQIFLNGQLLTPGSSNDYVLSGTTLTFQAAMTAPAATDVIRAYGTY